MTTFLIGLAILIIGGFAYGRFAEKVFQPDDRETPAIKNQDGVDYVPMGKKKNALIELLNIAGTGPILGPIQGILFGPLAFLMIPIGCVFGGALHDYMSGMISIRSGGEQMPGLIKRNLGGKVYSIYNIFVIILMVLVGAVFIYTPGDLIVTNVLKQEAVSTNPVVWIVYACIFAYYIAATLFPIDKIIGRVYPIFGGILLLSAVGIFFGLFFKGYQLDNLDLSNLNTHPNGTPILPVFFVTVACGIVSGFHSTQATLIGRSVKSEGEGRFVFYDMMILEGFIAMIWAAAAMGIYNKGIDAGLIGKPAVIGLVANDMLGTVGGLIAIIGIIVLPITSGDTALRSARLMIADHLNIPQKTMKSRLSLSIGMFICVLVILIFAKLSPNGFNVLWQYFAWANQTIAVFAFAMISIYLQRHGKAFLVSLIPGMFYVYVITAYIMGAKIGFNLPYMMANIIGVTVAILYAFVVYKEGDKQKVLARA
ncbi:carbon starvation protein A [Peptoniphilus sp. AGMB00490]|uniref:Carbon starvation protein A n=2 Tax=Peptoniphilus TaxID=162289 RepID=A0ACD6AYW0_9FIRM|nr:MULTISPECIES: carbon starvation CstA family protein [Peptoniphilus]NMW84323.1 carbon starvation protein A [Peptoniphilus faecalis]OLR64359.1 carbon starvation protein CstA [Peptoniphilus porci]